MTQKKAQKKGHFCVGKDFNKDEVKTPHNHAVNQELRYGTQRLLAEPRLVTR